MVRPQELVESVLYSLQQNSELPSESTFVGYEPDIDSEPISLPMIQVDPDGDMVDETRTNTQFVQYKRDKSGTITGKLYERLYSIEITVAVWTAHGSQYDPRNIGDIIRGELFQYDTSGPAKSLAKPDGTPIDEVWNFTVNSARQTDNLGTSPTLRRWQQSIIISASETYVEEVSEPLIEVTDNNTNVN